MTGDRGEPSLQDRIDQASDWFARMRGPEAETVRRAFETWLAKPGNADAYAEIEMIWAVAGSSRAHRHAGIDERHRWLVPALVAAMAIGAIGVGFAVVSHERSPRGSRELVYANSGSDPRTFGLADGSRVRLGEGARIAVAFANGERRVHLLSGSGRFAVAHDRAHPFVVLAAGRAVVARGTIFDVSLTRDGVSVTLVEGAVDLERRAKGRAPVIVGRLRAGEQATFVGQTMAPRIAAASAQPWLPGMLSGDGMRLADVIAEANHYGSTRIVLADAALGSLRISGGLHLGRGDRLAQTLAVALELRQSRRADGTIVLERTAQTMPVDDRIPGSPTKPVP